MVCFSDKPSLNQRLLLAKTCQLTQNYLLTLCIMGENLLKTCLWRFQCGKSRDIGAKEISIDARNEVNLKYEEKWNLETEINTDYCLWRKDILSQVFCYSEQKLTITSTYQILILKLVLLFMQQFGMQVLQSPLLTFSVFPTWF